MLDFNKKLVLKRINKTLDLSLLKGIEEKLNPENAFFKRYNYNLEIVNLENLLRLINDYDKSIKVLKRLLIPLSLYLIYYFICKFFALSLGLMSILLILFFVLLGVGIYFLWEIEEEYLILDSYNLLLSLLNGDNFNIKSYDFKLIDSRLCISTFNEFRLRIRYIIAKLFKLERCYYVFEYDKELSSVFEVKLIQDENLLNKEIELNFTYIPKIMANEFTFSKFNKSFMLNSEITDDYSEDLTEDKYDEELDGDKYE